jgi:hypothetical protein
MKVHLVRSHELGIGKFLDVLNVLQRFPGPVEFVSGESESEIRALQSRIWEREEDYEKQIEPPSMSINLKKSYCLEVDIDFPHEEKFLSWKELFEKCRQFRAKRGIPEEDVVFLLTEHGNEYNWFGSVGPSGKDFFIQTSGWRYFFGGRVDERFPVAYEVVIWLLRSHMYPGWEEMLHGVHKETRGCGNDFCKEKKDIILKMRTADLCHSCMGILQERSVPRLVLNQLFGIMDGIRSSMTFRSRLGVIQSPSRLEVRGRNFRMFLTDLGNLELDFNPKERSVYLFFLNHPEGVHLTCLQDHREEISSYYSRLTNQSDVADIKRSIDRLLNPLDNDINVVLSRIRRKIRTAVGSELSEIYGIEGPHGAEKRIMLDREFVVYPDKG